MHFNFEAILVVLTLFSGFVWLIDSLFFAKKRLLKLGVIKKESPGCLRKFIMIYGGVGLPQNMKMPKLIEYSRSFFPVLLLVLLVRTFVYEPYRIPSGSDKPTLLVGDLILVNKHIYGWRLPISNQVIYKNENPQRGDIVVFRFSAGDPSKDLIKRIIGLPGDHISYLDKVVYINGVKVPQEVLGDATDSDGQSSWPVVKKQEALPGSPHLIYQRPQAPTQNVDVIVPADHYFVLGDNRDDSYDSRYWGFVSQDDLKGKATRVWLSWNGLSEGIMHAIRWERIGKKIQ